MASSDAPAATLSGYVSHGLLLLLLRLTAVTGLFVLVLYAVIETSLRLAWPEWAFWLATVPLMLAMVAAVFASMWQSGTLRADADGVRVEYTRFPGGVRRAAWRWADVRGYRFDTDAQGRPYVHVTPVRGAGVSVYRPAGSDLSAFEAAFRAAAASASGADVSVVEEGSFYARPAVRWGSLALFAVALAFTAWLTHSDHPDAWRSLWVLALAFAFAVRAWV